MRVVILASRAFHLAHLARELARHGHDVVMFGYVPEFRMRHYTYGDAEYRSRFFRLLPLSAFALQRPLQALQRRSTDAIMSRLDEMVAAELPPCDVFIGLSGVALKSFTVAKRRYGALTVCDRGSAHVLHQRAAISGSGTFGLSDEYVARELGGYSAADYVMVPSRFAADSFSIHLPRENKVEVNAYGVRLDRFRVPLGGIRRNTARAGIQVLFVGAWTYQKGCDLLAEMVGAYPDLHLTHIGTPGDVEFPSSPNFQTLGHVDNAKLGKHFSQHDVFVLPSRQDGFGMVLLEALASGIPIVASSNTGGPDIMSAIDDPSCVEIIRFLDPRAVAEAIVAVTRRCRGRREILSEADRSRFSWNAYGDRYHAFLKRVTGS